MLMAFHNISSKGEKFHNYNYFTFILLQTHSPQLYNIYNNKRKKEALTGRTVLLNSNYIFYVEILSGKGTEAIVVPEGHTSTTSGFRDACTHGVISLS